MLLTDGQGHDLDLSRTPNVRYYLLSSFQHGTGNGTTTGICRQFSNPLSSAPVERALIVDLDQWVSEGFPPPASQVPRISDGTLVPPLPQSEQGFPKFIPNPNPTVQPITQYVAYNGVLHTGDLWDFGPQFDEGIVSIIPPLSLGTPYKIYVPKTDTDGNDIAGVRVPSVSVPIATYTGWVCGPGIWRTRAARPRSSTGAMRPVNTSRSRSRSRSDSARTTRGRHCRSAMAPARIMSPRCRRRRRPWWTSVSCSSRTSRPTPARRHWSQFLEPSADSPPPSPGLRSGSSRGPGVGRH